MSGPSLCDRRVAGIIASMMPQPRFSPLAAILATGLSVCGDSTALAAANETSPAGRECAGPCGQNPSDISRREAAAVLDYRNKPRVIVLLTDGEEMCGRQHCDLSKALQPTPNHLTVHVIGLRVKGYSSTRAESILDVKCLADQNEGLYITVKQEDELIDALKKTLGRPMLSQAPVR
jgi:hypothetical protein